MLNILLLIFNFLLHILFGGFLLHFIGLLFSYFVLNNIFVWFFNIFIFIFILGGIFFSFLFSNPVLIILSLLTSFIFLAFFLFTLGIEMLTFIFIIIYIGALMMLFLFIVMLFDISTIKQKSTIKFWHLFIFSFIFFFFIEIIFINLDIFSMSPWQNLLYIDFSTIFFFSTITLNSHLVFSTLFLQNAEDFFLIIIMFILLFSLVTAIRAATLTNYIVK